MRIRSRVLSAAVVGLTAITAILLLAGSPRVAYSDRDFAVDLHVHSDRSPDSVEPLVAVIDQALRVGLHAVAVTDHFVDRAFRELPERLSGSGLHLVASDDRFIRVEKGGRELLVIKGKEVSAAGGVHIIALAYRGHVHNFLSDRETLHEIRSAGGIAIVAHPFNTMSHGMGREALIRLLDDPTTREEIDAIEIYNANSFYPQWRANALAEALADERGVAGVAVSDAHQARHLGFGATVLGAPLTLTSGDAFAASLRAAIRAGARATGRVRVPLAQFADWFIVPKARALLGGRPVAIAPPPGYAEY